MQESLAHSPCGTRRRPDINHHSRTRLLSGMGTARKRTQARRCSEHSSEREALARSSKRLMVPALGGRSCWRGSIYRMVRACITVRVRQIALTHRTSQLLTKIGIFTVTFEPSCRNHWHIHHAEQGGGQILIITANVKHWHGAAKDSWFQHLAVEVSGEGASTEWCEPVSPSEYDKLP